MQQSKFEKTSLGIIYHELNAQSSEGAQRGKKTNRNLS